VNRRVKNLHWLQCARIRDGHRKGKNSNAGSERQNERKTRRSKTACARHTLHSTSSFLPAPSCLSNYRKTFPETKLTELNSLKKKSFRNLVRGGGQDRGGSGETTTPRGKNV